MNEATGPFWVDEAEVEAAVQEIISTPGAGAADMGH